MANKKRFIVTADFYIWADDEDQALKDAQEWALKQKKQYDNQAVIQELHSAPFGTLSCNLIYKKVN